MIGALIVVSLLALALIAAGVYDRRDHRRHIEHLLTAQDAERHSWDRQRWELMTRIQSPEVARYAPLPPPIAPTLVTQRAAEPWPVPEEEPDESHLVGQVIGTEPEA